MTREAVARILLVEDEEALAEGLRVNLHRKQYDVDVAGDGRTGLASAQARRYDLILLDIRLPEIDVDLLEEVLAEAWLTRAPKRLARDYLAGLDHPPGGGS